MALADIIARLSVELGLDTAAFEKGATVAEKRVAQSAKKIEAIGKSMAGLGQQMTIGVTVPLAALAASSIKAATESQQAIGQVEAALKSMGDAAGFTSEQLASMAGGVMRKSLYDDDDILRKVTANMLTFGTVTGDQFARAQQAAVDLAARMGTDLQSATLMVGKALNDPVKGLGALRKAGIQFTAQQKDQITAMAEVGNTAGAQKIMLAELERQFGGSAEAMRKADPMGALKQSWAEFNEAIGGQLLKALPAVAGALTGLLEAFNALPDGMQQGVVIAGALAAAFGPLLTVFGALVSASAPFTAAIGYLFANGGVLAGGAGIIRGLTAAFGPWGIAAAAVATAAVLIYENWDKIGPVLEDLWKTIQTTIGPPLMDLIDALTDAFNLLWKGPMGEAVRVAGQKFMELQASLLDALGPKVIDGIKIFAQILGTTFQAIAVAVRMVTALFDGSFKNAVINAAKAMYNAVAEWLGAKLDAVWERIRVGVEKVKGFFYGMYDAVVGHSYVPDMVEEIAAQFNQLDSVMVSKAKTATERTKEHFKQLKDDVDALMRELFPEAEALNDYRRKLGLIDYGEKSGRYSKSQSEEARHRVRFGGIDEGSRAAIEGLPTEIDIPTVAFELKGLEVVIADVAKKTQAHTVQIAKSFGDMAKDTMASIQETANAIKSGDWLSILTSVVNLFLQLGSTGLFGKKIQGRINLPKYAAGTGYHPGGLALVGEHGPEIAALPGGTKVLPNRKLGGGNNYYIEGNLLTPEFWAKIQMGDALAADAGANLGMQRISRKQSRRLG